MAALSGLQRFLQPHAQRLSSLFPRLQITSVRRSRTQQLLLWNTRYHNPYPVAPPGSSKHELGLAFDMVGPREQLYQAGAIWNSWGGHWSPVDEIHFEYAGNIGRRRRRG
jgi:hypothetical protein